MPHVNYITEQEIDNISGATGKKLKAQKKVRIIIQPDGVSQYWEGGINGHFFRIPRNAFVEIPEDLAVLIEQSAQVLRDKEKTEKKFGGNGAKIEI